MKLLKNPYIGKEDAIAKLKDVPMPSTDAARAFEVVQNFPNYAVTPLETHPSFAARLGIHQLYVKNESKRTLGSFKSLGARYVIARLAQEGDLSHATFVCASAGNHGLSVALGAKENGANAVVYIDNNVPERFEQKLVGLGAHVIRYGESYHQVMKASKDASLAENWSLISDQSWDDYLEVPRGVMEGYLVMMSEIIAQIDEPPTHIFLQAGVGGMAASCAAMARKVWGDTPTIVVVEPRLAPALYESIAQAAPVNAGDGVSNMGRLDCKEPSLIALKGLAHDANYFALIDEDEGLNGARECETYSLMTTTSGAAGIAAVIGAEKWHDQLKMDSNSRVLVILSEGNE